MNRIIPERCNYVNYFDIKRNSFEEKCARSVAVDAVKASRVGQWVQMCCLNPEDV